MDLLYSRYASPLELMNTYFEQGRFGEFVSNIYDLDQKRLREEAEKENDRKLWELYLRTDSRESFNDWKASVTKRTATSKAGDTNMTDSDIEGILQRLFKK